MARYLCIIAVLYASMSIGSPAFAEEPLPRAPSIKPAHTTVPAHHRRDAVAVKFRDDLTIRAVNGTLTDRSSGDLDTASQAVLKDLGGGQWDPAYSPDESRLEQLRQTAQKNLGRAVADLRTQFIFRLPSGADAATTIDMLNALDIVEIALPLPEPVPLPLPPSYQSNQGYLNAATAGVDALGMWANYGANGAGVRIADLEYSWNLNHQDLGTVTLLGPAPVDPFSDDNHGTAVLGEFGALSNGWGVTGIAYGVTKHVVATNTSAGWNIGAAITTALGTLSAGDVILIEQQYAGPNYTGSPPGTQVGLIPVEWYLPWYNAIVTAVGNNVVVVEAAGNGSQNLDDAIYSTGNGGHWPFLPANDSGAIIVGAGASPGGSDVDRSRLYFSNYGSTVDLQGWGENVYTTGYGGLYGAEGANLYYTASFSGTSSASPIVAGSCVLLQSMYKALHPGSILTPATIKNNLRSTGSPQQSGAYPASQNIGPRPNVTAAAAQYAADNCSIAIAIGAGTSSGTTAAATNDGSASCGASATSPDVWYKYVATGTGTMTVDTCAAASFNTVLSVHAACPGTTGNEIACNDDNAACGSGSTRSYLTVPITAGNTYYIRVAGYNGATGTFTLTLTVDSAPPTPNPMTFQLSPSGAPAPISTSQITMTATEATDPSGPVQYFFSATGSGSHSSSWQTSRTYTDSGLFTNRSYSYKVKARDAMLNTTADSGAVAVATFIETPTGLSFGAITDTSIVANALGTLSRLNQNLSGLYFEVITLDGAPAGSGTGVNSWTSLSLSQTATVAGLSPGTTYRFRVKARNYYGVNETPWYPAVGYVQQATTGAAPCSLPGDVNQDGLRDGRDIDGFVRAKLGGAPLPGENQACANYGGTLAQDITEFVVDLIGP